ncbi:TPA: hypothetical protein DIC21_05650 [Candidatus Uhrbacteria bacterium]|nr:hypothetical protein [Candidatus Uhrbacteria bacterium]
MAQNSQKTAMAVLAYIIFFIPLLTGDAKKDEFVKFHTKQGLVLFLTYVVINIVHWILPYQLYWSIGWVFWLLGLGVFVLFILGIVNAVNDKKEPLPIIGSLSNMFKF